MASVYASTATAYLPLAKALLPSVFASSAEEDILIAVPTSCRHAAC